VFGGDFEVVDLLSDAGGMGLVYRAVQRSTGYRCALKVMQPALLAARDPARVAKNQERFLAEARVGSRVESAHVVRVLAAGVEPSNGAPWMAMELLSGEGLDGRLRRLGRLTPEEVRVLFRQLGHALGAAHRAGVLHLDLKPENLFVCAPMYEGAPFTVKVLDFGIARMVQEHRQSATVTTAIGSPF
jgi:serine/threonine-protein kinase